MIQINGTGSFKDNIFDPLDWSAPVLQTPEEVFDAIAEFRIVGRVIQDIRSIGFDYNSPFDGDYDPKVVEAYADEQFYRTAEIDDPMLIRFEDGDILGIDFSDGSCVRMSLNTIPWDIKESINAVNFSAKRMFSGIIGKPIRSVDIVATTEYPMFTDPYDWELSTDQKSYIDIIDFIIYNSYIRSGDWPFLEFKPRWDYGLVSLLDHERKLCPIDFEDYKNVDFYFKGKNEI